uniref:Uncharacterized protein n=1 Tax=Glossina austeni TaxID=7395 RepID=A0A1A9VFB2_GLOAU
MGTKVQRPNVNEPGIRLSDDHRNNVDDVEFADDDDYLEHEPLLYLIFGYEFVVVVVVFVVAVAVDVGIVAVMVVEVAATIIAVRCGQPAIERSNNSLRVIENAWTRRGKAHSYTPSFWSDINDVNGTDIG